MQSNPQDISDAFTNSVKEIIESQAQVQFDVVCKIMLPTGVEVEILPDNIHLLSVLEYFKGDYCSVSTIDLDIPISIYRIILEHRQGIHMTIEIHYDQDDSLPVLPDQSIIINEYLAVLQEKGNPELIVPEKRLSDPAEDVVGQEEHTLPVTLELIPEHVYSLRKTKLNFILNEATMEDTMIFIAHLFGIAEVYIVPPDNEKVYDNIVIPPLLDISNIFNYLQDNQGYGVYNDGISHYFQAGVLYIMPMNKCLTDSESKMKIYNVGENAYPNMHNYFMMKDDELNVVVNSKIVTANESHKAIENIGNAYIVNKPSTHLDSSGTLVTDDVFQVNNEIVENVMRYNDNAGIGKESFTQSYIKSDNLFDVTSMISETEPTIISMTWVHALPYQILPIMDISYLFDKGDMVTEIKGWVHRVQYNITRTKNMDNVKFGCVSSIFLGCEDFE